MTLAEAAVVAVLLLTLVAFVIGMTFALVLFGRAISSLVNAVLHVNQVVAAAAATIAPEDDGVVESPGLRRPGMDFDAATVAAANGAVRAQVRARGGEDGKVTAIDPDYEASSQTPPTGRSGYTATRAR